MKGMFITETFLIVISYKTAQSSLAYKLILTIVYIVALTFSYKV